MRFLYFLVLLGVVGGLRGAETAETFDTRREAVLDAVDKDFQASRAKPSAHLAFWRAEALFEHGHVEEGRRLIGRGLDQLEPGNKENRWIHGGNSGFTAWPGLDCYIRYQRFLNDELRERYRAIYTGAVFYRRLSTSNHKIMAAVTRYLATEIWGNDAFHRDPRFKPEEDIGTYFTTEDPTGEKYIRETITNTVRSGPGEYASRPYGAENVLPLLTIAECATDRELATRAEMAYECALLQLAPAYLDGHLGTFAPRSYPDTESQQPWGIAALLWTYFGGIAPAHPERDWSLRAMTAVYRLPPHLLPVGMDRSAPYVYRARMNRWALYHYVNRDYILFSRSPKPAASAFQGQSYPCGVMWREADLSKGSHLWITNPAADDNNVDGNKPSGIHTHGVTKFEREVQFEDALLFVFDIPKDFRNPYVLGYVPGGCKASLTGSNALYFHYGSVLIAVTASSPIQWEPGGGIRAPASPPRAGDSEFRIPAILAAVAVETARSADWPASTPEGQLRAYRDTLEAKCQLTFDPAKKLGTYRDRKGNEIWCEFDGIDRINGNVVDYAHWPVVESPWTLQNNPDGPLRAGKMTYDFQKWVVTK